jgi:predicted DNA-binding transcriptional regulator AlpA
MPERSNFMNRQPFETMPDVMDAKQIAEALQISKAGAYNLLNDPDFPTLRIGGRKLVMKADLMDWLKGQTNHKRKKEDLNMFMEIFKKIMEERKGDPIPSIPIPDENEQEVFEKLKREILSIANSK